MRIAICDDNNVQIELLKHFLSLWASDRNQPVEIFDYPNAEAFLFAYEDVTFDVILLDIQMKEMNGVELAKVLRSKKDDTAIVFITGITDYVFEGYNVKALNYLLKPVKEEKLYQCLDQVVSSLNLEKPFILVDENHLKKIYLKDIIYLESMGHNCIINCMDEVITSKKGIQSYDDTLDHTVFYRCHRSYIINISKVASISKTEVTMTNASVIPISRGKWENLNKLFLKYCRSSLC